MKQDNAGFDTKVPAQLKKTQKWFASIIVRPVDEDNRMNFISPSGDNMEEETFDYIVPSPSLRPAQRIQIYNQQYWWRLLSILHESAPLATRLFGYYDFNQQIAIPYLMKYPPDTWSLNLLAGKLPEWVEKEYHANDKQLVLDAVSIDAALNSAFFVKHHKAVDDQALAGGNQEILSTTLHLQPHVYLFDLRYDLFTFRKEMLAEEVEYWMSHDFPKLIHDRKHYFVVYRNTHNNLNWEEVEPAEFKLLQLFLQGSTVDNACEWLENDEELYEEAAKNLHLWLQKWVFRQWLYIPTNP